MTVADTDFVSVSEAKAFVQIADSETDQDDVIAGIISLAVGWIDVVTGTCRGDGTTEITEYCDGGARNLWLKKLPVISITSIQERGQTDVIDNTKIDSFGFPFYEQVNNRIWRCDGWIWDEGVRQFKVIYKAGYTAATWPAPLKQVALKLIHRLYNNRGGETNDSGFGVSQAWQEMGSDIKRLIIPFKVGQFAV